jgi:spore coat protein CotF
MAVTDQPINKEKFLVERRLIEINAALRDLRLAILEATSPEARRILQQYAADFRREKSELQPRLKRLNSSVRPK